MTIEEFNKNFKMLVSYYPNTKLTQELMDIYFLGLSELKVEDFRKAIGRIIKEYGGDFLPKISLILKYAKNEDIDNKIIQAKKLLKTAISKAGNSGMIAFEDKGIHAVVDYVGWLRLCKMDLVEFDNFLNFQFDKIYKDFLETKYKTSDYYKGVYEIYGQKEPRVFTYALDDGYSFKVIENKKQNRIDTTELSKKMVVGLRK